MGDEARFGDVPPPALGALGGPGTNMSRIQAVMNRPPRWCRYAGPLADLIHGLLAKDPRDRTDAVRARRLLDDDGWASWWVG